MIIRIFAIMLIAIGCRTTTNDSEGKDLFRSHQPSQKDASLNPELYPDVNPHGDISEEQLEKYRERWKSSNTTLATNHQLPLYTHAKDCENLVQAIKAANFAILHGKKCRAWFNSKNPNKPLKRGYLVADTNWKGMCLATNVPAWGFPYMKRIGFCRKSCKESAGYLASIVLHEYAHHYCPKTIGRETCAIEAQDTCANEMSDFTFDKPKIDQ